MSDRAEVRYLQTGDDMVRGLLDNWLTDDLNVELRRLARKRIAVGVFAILGSIGIGLLLAEIAGIYKPEWGEPEARILGGAMGAVIGAIFLSRASSTVIQREHVHTLIEQAKQSVPFHCDAEITLRVTPEAFWLETDGISVRWAWPAIRTNTRLGWCDQLVSYDNRVLLIPVSAHEDDAARDAFCALVARYNEEGGGDAAVIDRFLRLHDFPCPACGYQMRGTEGARCPECGKSLELDEFETLYARSLKTPPGALAIR